ncbi:hypothetical protein IFM89_007427 [Coptis chinensis]|uniref:Uncharacterized protein n=1 Tax=Coptis chinensis TaxID=261450 RepID=A0A835IA05_9MAGN|nr:hypothetical protein IFM89_007427 [Coptis chinensis]
MRKRRLEVRLVCLLGVQGLGGGLPDLRSKKKGKQKVLKENHVIGALEKLKEQTQETVRGLESTTYKQKVGGGDDDLGKEEMMEDWVKQFEELAGSQPGAADRVSKQGEMESSVWL